MRSSYATGIRWDGQPYTATAAQIASIMTLATGTAMCSGRYRLLDRRTRAPIPTGRRGPYGDDGDITDYVLSCQVAQDATQAVMGAATVTLREAPEFTFNPLTQAIQSFCVYWLDGATVAFEEPTGIWVVPIGTRTIDADAITTQYQMLDLKSDLAIPFLNSWNCPKGANVTTAITAMLTCGYLPVSRGGTGQTPSGLDCAGPNVPASRISIPATTQTLPADRLWTRKDSFTTAIDAIARSIAWRPLRVDAMGIRTIAPATDLSQGTPTPVWPYASGVASVIELPVSEQSPNAASLGNIVGVYVENTSGPSFAAYAYNQNSGSALALDRIGYARPIMINDSGIVSQADANARAHLELQRATGLEDQIIVSVPPNPWLEPFDPMKCTILDPQGQITVSSDTGWELTGFTLDADAATMQLTLTRFQIV